jgi:hypothetical protein
VGWKWCKEAREEFNAAKESQIGSPFKGEVLDVIRGIVNGSFDISQAHKLIKPAPVFTEHPWTILYGRQGQTHIGLCLLHCRVEDVPKSAYAVAQERLDNLVF